jgi:hypothetical protein
MRLHSWQEKLTPVKHSGENSGLFCVHVRLGGDVVGQPIEKGVTDKLGEKETHGEFDDSGDPERSHEPNSVLLFMAHYRRHFSLFFFFFLVF